MTDIAGVAVSLDVARPLKLGRIWVAGADVASLKLLKLLLSTKLVRLDLAQYNRSMESAVGALPTMKRSSQGLPRQLPVALDRRQSHTHDRTAAALLMGDNDVSCASAICSGLFFV
jgi:hypothetical protein